MSEEKAIEKVEQKILGTTEKTYSNIIDYARDLSCEPVVKTNCKLCNSIHRKQAEDMFAEGANPYKLLS